MNRKSSNKGLVIVLLLLLFGAAIFAAVYFYIIPNYFAKDSVDTYHLQDYMGYETTTQSMQTVKFENISMNVPVTVSVAKGKKGQRVYKSDDSKFVITILPRQSLTYSLDDLTKIGGAEEFEKFVQLYTDQDPYSKYALSYVIFAINAEKKIDGYDTASNLQRLVVGAKRNYCKNAYDIMHYRTDELIGFIRKIDQKSENKCAQYEAILYRTNDLNLGYIIQIQADNEENAFGIINSIQISEPSEKQKTKKLEREEENKKKNTSNYFSPYMGYWYTIDEADSLTHNGFFIPIPKQMVMSRENSQGQEYKTLNGDCYIGLPKDELATLQPPGVKSNAYMSLVNQYTDEDPYTLYSAVCALLVDNAKSFLGLFNPGSEEYKAILMYSGMLNSTYDKVMHYETDTMIGFVFSVKQQLVKGMNTYGVYLFDKNDLNQCCYFLIASENDETTYGIINSVHK